MKTYSSSMNEYSICKFSLLHYNIIAYYNMKYHKYTKQTYYIHCIIQRIRSGGNKKLNGGKVETSVRTKEWKEND